MLTKPQTQLNVFINDNYISFVVAQTDGVVLKQGVTEIPNDIVRDGRIKQPNELLDMLDQMFKAENIKEKRTRIAVSERAVLVKPVRIEKVDIGRKTLRRYIKSLLNKSIRYPFERAVMDYHIVEETEDYYQVLVMLVDDDLLQDYLDLFAKLKRHVTFDLISLAMGQLYYESLSSDEDFVTSVMEEDNMIEGLMTVMFFDDHMAIMVYDKEVPVLALNEDFERPSNPYIEMTNYIERITHYYQYSIHKGKKSINHIKIVNVCLGVSDTILQNELKRRFTTLPFSTYQHPGYEGDLEDLPPAARVPYAIGLKLKNTTRLQAQFAVMRLRPIDKLMDWVLVASSTLLVALFLIYFPWVNYQGQVNSINSNISSLQVTLTNLQQETQPNIAPTFVDPSWLDAKESLLSQESSNIAYLESALVFTESRHVVVEHHIIESQGRIVLFLSGATLNSARETATELFERFGIGSPFPEEETFITVEPQVREVGPFIEVVINYAP